MSVEPFNRLVRLTARAFYDHVTAKADHHQTKVGRSDNRGIAVVVLDALTRRQWVREEDLAKALKLQLKQLRRTLQILKDDKLVSKDQRKETAKGAKVFSTAVAATSDGQRREGEEKMKTHTHSYWCLDYAQLFDVVRYRLHLMKKDLKDKLDKSNTVQRYICPKCGKRYSAFDALLLGSQNDEYFQCEICNGEVVPESNKLTDETKGDGEREKLKDMCQKMEEQLKPLTLQLARLKDLEVPDFGSLQTWEVRANAAAIAKGNSNADDAYKSVGTPLPFLGETKVEVALAGGEVKDEGTGTDTKAQAMKVLPPWMIKQDMNLTNEQRGEVKSELNMDESSTFVDDKKPKIENEDEKSIQHEYLQAYYAALVKRQEEQEEASKRVQKEGEMYEASTFGPPHIVSETPSERQVGMKSKREQDGNDDVEWEGTLPIDNTGQTFTPTDPIAQSKQSDDEDDIDWEDG